MKYNPEIHHRRSIRLRGYDYSQNGLYFITICTQHRECLFGKITNGVMQLNLLGEIAHNEWQRSAEIRSEIQLHEFIIMPNHTHGIIEVGARRTRPITDTQTDPSLPTTADTPPIDRPITDDEGRVRRAPTVPTTADTPPIDRPITDDEGCVRRAPTVGDIVRGYKSSVSKQINQIRNTPGGTVWHRNYYEHIIRNETAYLNISAYIQTNPQRWKEDTFHI